MSKRLTKKAREGLSLYAEFARAFLDGDGWQTPSAEGVDKMRAASAWLGQAFKGPDNEDERAEMGANDSYGAIYGREDE